MRTESGSPHVETVAVPVQAQDPVACVTLSRKDLETFNSRAARRFSLRDQSSRCRNLNGGTARAVSMPGLTGRLLHLYLSEEDLRMNSTSSRYQSRFATAVFDLLNPIPYGCFVATLIFDVVYANTADVLWAKGAAWLVTVGLLFAIVPRFINLFHVWFPSRYARTSFEKLDFWLNLVGIVAAILNPFPPRQNTCRCAKKESDGTSLYMLYP
jgi:uncharacterized membrane protein